MPVRVRPVRSGAVAAAAALLVLAGGPPCAAAPVPPGAEQPGAEQPVGELLASFQALYREAETATAAYETTGGALKKQKAEVEQLGGELARARVRLARGRDAVGRLAREQYRDGSGGLSPFMRAVLSDDPQLALDQRHLYERAASARAAALLRLRAEETRLDALAGKARKALDKQQTLADRQREQYDEVRARFTDVQEVLASLSPGELAALGASGGGTETGGPTGTGTGVGGAGTETGVANGAGGGLPPAPVR